MGYFTYYNIMAELPQESIAPVELDNLLYSEALYTQMKQLCMSCIAMWVPV